jgi:hypothetical protein
MSDDDFSDIDFEDEEYEEFSDDEQDQDVEDNPINEEENEDNNDHEKEDMPQSRRTSPTWKYFNDNTPQHPGHPVCCKCQRVFAKKVGISTLKRHLLLIHKIKIDNIKNTVKNQTTLNFKRVDPWPEKEKKERDNAVVEWIIGDAQPFRSVENMQFKQMINTFDSRYQVPDKKTIKSLVKDYFKEKRDNIRCDLDVIPGKLSLTADIWTSINNDIYLGLTIHYVDSNWKLKNFLLDIISFTTRHTGINIADTIKAVLVEFHLLEKTLALTTDNESAMIVCERTIAALELNNQTFRHYRCSAHILNLAAQQGIKVIDKEVINIRDLMKKIKNSPQRCNRLRELCLVENLQYYKPQLDVETRWNSTYYMIVKFQKMLLPIEMLAATDQDIRDLIPNEEGWKKINVRSLNLINLLLTIFNIFTNK